MSRIDPVPLDAFPASLAEALVRGRASRMLSSSLPVQVWAHRPKVAEAWLAALEEMHLNGVLDGRLKELVRLKIASITTCQVCQVARKDDSVTEADIACLSTDSERFSGPERSALRYAELFAGDYLSIDDTIYADLARWFSTPQIVELNLFCALMLAGGRMTYVQQAYEENLA
jgi:alkylhydroperoxidase family enzyme